MANSISKIKIPSGTVYEVKDDTSRGGITDLRSKIDNLNSVVGASIERREGSATSTYGGTVTILSGIRLKVNGAYKMTATLNRSISDQPVVVELKKPDGTVYQSVTIPVGETTTEPTMFMYIGNTDLENCYVTFRNPSGLVNSLTCTVVIDTGTAKPVDNISKKLDKPSTEGTAGQVVASDGNGGTEWVNMVEVSAEATQLPEGSSPTVTSALVSGVPTLTFGIPAGATGATGEKGGRGDTVVIAKDYADLTFPVYAGKTYCYYDNKPYLANTDIATAEAWTAAHWDEVSFEDEIGDLKSAIYVLEPAATNSDVGKTLVVKTVSDGKVTEYEFGKTGSSEEKIGQELSILDAKVKELVEYTKNNQISMSSLNLVQGKFWGNGGLRDITSAVGTYYAVSQLIDVSPGDILLLSDFGKFSLATSAAIGFYNASGADAPGRVNFEDSYILHYFVESEIVKYVITVIPDGCYKVGLFYIEERSTTPKYQLFEFDDLSDKLKSEITTVVHDISYTKTEIDAEIAEEHDYTAKRLAKIGDFTEVGYTPVSELGTVTDKYWGDNGLASASGYVALSSLISVNAGDFIYLKDFGSISQTANAAIGMYDNDGVKAPGRVNYNSEYVKELDWQGRIVNSAKIQVPEGCSQVGLFYKTDGFTGNPQFKIGEMVLELNEDFKALIQTIIIELLSHVHVEAKDIEADYYLYGKSNKLPRTKKLCIIGAGQSNIDGRNPVGSLPAGITLPMSGMKYIKNSTVGIFDNAFPSGNWGFDLVVCHEIISNIGIDNLCYIKWSQGGTSLDITGDGAHWTPDYDEISPKTNALLHQFNLEINKCAEINPNEYEIGAMIWHQGEGDRGSRSPTAAANYYMNFRKLIAYCRGMASNPKLPFICGTISENSEQYDAIVDAAIRQVAAEDDHVYLVDLSDAVLQDQYHFNAAWSEYFGKKVYDCLIDAGVITGTKINPSKPT